MDYPTNSINLGTTDIKVSPMGIGTWAWGNKTMWGYGSNYDKEDVAKAFNACIEGGSNFFDTAEAYAWGLSERILGELLLGAQTSCVIATKFMPYPWRLTSRSLHAALKNSLHRLRVDRVDLYQIHWPFPPISIETWVNAIGDCVEQGLVRAIGVSNYNLSQTKRALSVLVKRDLFLASNQVEYSLLNRNIEFNGLLSACKELGISIIAYSPLAQGLLTGKYTPTNPPPGIRGLRINRSYLDKIQPLIRMLREIGRAHDGKAPSQVALNWTIMKGTIPIPGVKNLKQATENLGALRWSLSPDELEDLDRESARIQQQ